MKIFQDAIVTGANMPLTNGLSWRSYLLTGLTVSSTFIGHLTGNAAFPEDAAQQEAAAL